MMKPKAIRHRIEYGAARAGLALVDRMSVAAADAFVRVAADAWYAADARRRRVTRENIMASGVARDAADADRIARESYRHFGRVVMESLKAEAILSAAEAGARIRTNFSPELERLLDDPRQGIILASGHYGSWEIAAQILSRRKPVVGVTRRMNNPHVDRLMQKRKPRDRFKLVPKFDPADQARFLDILRQGDLLALMIDPYAGGRGMLVDFLGRPASTHTAIALLHLVTRAPICFGYCRRTADGYELQASGPFRFERTGDKQRDIRLVLETLTRELEKAIRQDPTQYLWAHQRWRRPAPGSA